MEVSAYIETMISVVGRVWCPVWTKYVPFTKGIYNYIFTNKCSVYGSVYTYRNIVIFERVALWTIRNLAYMFGEPNECASHIVVMLLAIRNEQAFAF